METCLRRRRRVARRQRPAGARARTRHQPAVRRLLRRRAGGLPAHRPTSTATARRASPASTATSPRPPAERRTRLSAPGEERPNLTCHTRAMVNTRPVRGHHGHRRRVHAAAGQPAPWPGQEIVLCGGAFNTPQLLQLSGVGNADELMASSASRGRTTWPASASTCRTTSRSTSSTRARSRCPSAAQLLQFWQPAHLACTGCSARARREQPLRVGVGSCAATTTSTTRT
jgi:hypothetical protein